jgi:indoleacetamide hydrolase
MPEQDRRASFGAVIASFAFGPQRDAIAFPTTPKVAIAANTDSSSLSNFTLSIQNTDPGSNAGVPGIQIPIALGAASKLPIGLELDGPSGSDRRLLAIGVALDDIFGRLPPPAR